MPERARPITRAVVALVLTLAAGLGPSVPAPAAPQAKAPLDVRVSQPTVSVSEDATFTLRVTTRLPAEAGYFECRLRLRRPSGRLLYQKTEVRHDASGTVTIDFARSLAGFEMSEGRYPIEVQVRATGADVTAREDRLLVVGTGRAAVPVSIVVRLACTPMIDPAGRFVNDPAVFTGTRDQARELAALAREVPAARITLAAPPILLDEWRRIAGGYQMVGPEGLTSVSGTAPASAAYADTLAELRDLVREGRIELLDVPFAEPDVAALDRIGAVGDLAEHYRRGSSAYLASLGATPQAGTTVLGDVVPPAALPVLAERGMRFAVLRPEGLRGADGTAPAPGVLRVAETTLTALITDSASAHAVRDGDADAYLDRLFDRLASDATGTPVVTSVAIGPGAGYDVTRLRSVLGRVSSAPWVRFVHASDAAGFSRAVTQTVRPRTEPPAPDAPAGYWDEVAEARRQASAFFTAAGERDSEAESAWVAALMAESRCWAGPDGRWSLADRGRSFAGAADRSAREVLGKVSVKAQDLTLSGRKGKVPVSLANVSGKTLRVVVRPRAGSMLGARTRRIPVVLRPDDTYLTIPVDLGPALSDRLTVTVYAGDLAVAEQTVTVRASYLDRLAVVGSIVVVLAGMLLFIRRRVQEGTGSMRDTVDAP